MTINLKKMIFTQKGLLSLLGGCILIQLIVSVLFPYLTKFIVDNVLIKHQTGALKSLLLMTFILILFLIPINIAVSYLCSKFVQNIVFDLRKEIGSHFLNDRENAKDNGLFINSISSDSEVIGNQLLNLLIKSVPNLLLIFLYLVALLSLNLKLTLYTFLSFPLFIFIAYVTSKKVFQISKQLQDYRDRLINFLNSYVRNKLPIDLYGLKEEENKIFFRNIRSLRGLNIKSNTLLSFLININGLISTIVPLFTILWGSTMVIHHELSIGSLLVFNTYVGLMFSPLSQILDLPALYAQMKVSIERLEKSIQPYFQVNEDYQVKPLPSSTPLIIDNLIPLVNDTPIFSKSLSFRLERGKFIRITGANGIGKSVLLKCLIDYHSQFTGKIQKRMQDRVFYVPQETFLFEGSVKDNLTKGLETYSVSELENLIEHLKFDVDLGQTVSPFTLTLSSGQLQKIKLIRALLSEPTVLLLDEVLSNLEESVIKDILHYLKSKHLTVLFVYHGNFEHFFEESNYDVLNLNDFSK